jgi:hypothetical protein
MIEDNVFLVVKYYSKNIKVCSSRTSVGVFSWFFCELELLAAFMFICETKLFLLCFVIICRKRSEICDL